MFVIGWVYYIECFGQVWRIGLMGYNSKKCNVELVLKALKNAMENVPRLNSD